MRCKLTVSPFVAAAALVLLFCAGCSTTAGIEATGKKSWDQDGAPELTRHVLINGSSLARSLEIVELKNAPEGKLMKAQVSFRSKERGTLPVEYKFEWYDAEGMEISGNTAWKPLLVYAGEFKTVQGVAPDTRAQEFRVKIREPDKD